VIVDAETQQKRPAFDHAGLAAGLSKATGSEYTAQRLPFNNFQFVENETAIQLNMPGQGGVGPGGSWQCRLSDYSCSSSTGGWSGGAAAAEDAAVSRALRRRSRSHCSRRQPASTLT
jgi:hypothetical protein